MPEAVRNKSLRRSAIADLKGDEDVGAGFDVAYSGEAARPLHVAPTFVQQPGERRNISKSAIRALDLLEYFAVVKRPLRATDIAHAFNLHPSSTDQLLKTMVDSAYLLIDPLEKLYYPSPRLVRFANWLTSGYYG
ncbi:MAG: hypothetical protein JWO33_134, partial [Caulobacteraceae bacterium]|nr:hypothetical protein [Caulobacteraceae bacterium]